MKKDMEKVFTGDYKIYTEIKNSLLEKRFRIKDAVHTGNNRYEFEENWNTDELGIHNIHKILAWKDGDEIKYKTEVIGYIAND